MHHSTGFLLKMTIACFVSLPMATNCQEKGPKPGVIAKTGQEKSMTNQKQIGQAFKPQVAGMFYPANRENLSRLIRGYLDEAKGSRLTEQQKPLGIIVPHAGYPYSGPVAAHAFQPLSGHKYARVVVLAPAHQRRYRSPALLDYPVYLTPMGELPIDQEAIKKIADTGAASVDNSKFLDEHALEVELPFLQAVLTDFKLVPIMISDPDPNSMKRLAKTLRNLFHIEDTLYVVSTDMSHDHSYDVAVAMDKNALRYVQALDPEGLYRANQAYYRAGHDIKAASDGRPQPDCAQLCGLGPVLVMLELARLKENAKVVVLDRRNSGDIVGDKSSRIVGYFSAAIISKKANPKKAKHPQAEVSSQTKQPYFLTNKEKNRLLSIARKTLEIYFEGRKIPDFNPPHPRLTQPGAAFVTLKKRGSLRGCIGHMEPTEPLWKMVRDRALDAALHDPRFKPVDQRELKDLHIEISVLSPRITVNEPLQEVVIGRDGVWIEVGMRRGVFLPQVPVEQGWKTVGEYLDHLCLKAHIHEPECWKHPKAHIQRFTTLVFSE